MSAFGEKALEDHEKTKLNIRNMEGLINKQKVKLTEKAREINRMIDVSVQQNSSLVFAANQLKNKEDNILKLQNEVSDLKEQLKMYDDDVVLEG